MAEGTCQYPLANKKAASEASGRFIQHLFTLIVARPGNLTFYKL